MIKKWMLTICRLPRCYPQYTISPATSIEQLIITSLAMADTRPSRPDKKFPEGNRKFTWVSEPFHKTVYTYPRCDEGDDCESCSASYHHELQQLQPQFSYRRRLTDGEAEEITSRLVFQIQDDRRHISGRLKRHADIVISRWTKNGIYGSQQKREDLLKEVAADIAKTPEDIIVFNYSQQEVPYTSRSLQSRHMLLLPWLDAAVLKTTPDALLALFHCRSAYGPSEWAAFDMEQIRGHWYYGHFDADYSRKTIVLYGEQEYGNLVDWDVEQIHRGDTLGFPLGILVLEAQAYLMGILRRALEAILQGIDDVHPVRTEKWQQATATGTFRRANDDTKPWSSYTWGAFCAPPKFDLEYWASLAQSRREKAEDHLRALQCDPAYMRRCIRVVVDSAQWRQISAKTKGVWFAGKICQAMESYYLWLFMEDECRRASEVCRRHGDSVCVPGRSLPQEVDQALCEFDNWVLRQVIFRNRALIENLAMSPAFSKHWSSKPARSSTISYERVTDNDSMTALREDPLDWYLGRIVEVSGTSRIFDRPRLFYFLEEYLSTCKVGERRRLDELMVDAINDLAAVREIANATCLRRPCSPIISEEAMYRITSMGNRAHIRAQIDPSTDHMFNRVCTETGPDLLKAFQQSKPPQGLKGQAWIDQQRVLHSSLTAFWDSIRELKKDDFSRTDLSAEEAEELLKVISADLSPEHQEAVKSEEDAVYAGMKKPREVSTAASTVFIGEADKPQTPKCNIGRAKKKKKTRPDTPADVQAEEALSDVGKLSLEGEAQGEPIAVPRKVFEEFVCKVFPADKNQGKQGVDWQMFVRGMTAVGCSVTNSGGGGSEVLFSHESFGKITFHRPHPEPRVDAIKLHAWAQRLQRRFGWSHERFVVAGAQPSEATEGSKDASESRAS